MCITYFPILPAYGGTLIEHCLMEVGLSGNIKVDSQEETAQGTVLFDVTGNTFIICA